MPGDKLQFRVIVVNVDLKPPLPHEAMVSVYVQDPDRNVIHEWSNVSLYSGVFENQIAISTIPLAGTYIIEVTVNGKYLVSNSFQVTVDDLNSIDLNIYPTIVPLREHQALNLTIDIKNIFGKSVSGRVKIDLFLEEDELDSSWNDDVNGLRQVYLRFARYLDISGPEHDVTIVGTFTAPSTITSQITKRQHITVYNYQYKVKLAESSLTYLPGTPFTATLKVTHHNEKPASNVTLLVRVQEVNRNHDRNCISNLAGDIIFSLETTTSTQITSFIVSKEINFWRDVETNVKFNRMLRLMVTCSHNMSILLFYVISKGNIAEFGCFRPNQMNRYTFQVLMSEKLIPRSKILVVTKVNQRMILDYVDVSINEFGNPLKINIEENISEDGVDPGDEIELSIRGRPGAFVALTAYDKRLLQHNSNHDILMDDIWKMFDEFHSHAFTYDPIEELGLHALLFDESSRIASKWRRTTGVDTCKFFIEYALPHLEFYEYNARGIHPDAPRFGMPGPYRTDFWESWLWQNLTIPASGRFELVTTVPHSATSWYITGFSVDPKYGLGIVKAPIPFSTFKILFIMEHLPHSIKRGKTVSLHFTLVNNLKEEFDASVTMFNVMNQIRFVQLPSGAANETKNVFVPRNSDVPISFLIKAMKLGELEIRVNASVLQGVISDSFKKIIRVLPEDVKLQNSNQINFHHLTYTNQLFDIPLSTNEHNL
uniref:Alpha-2-macroglobulin domain-containing protein n=1 Tax=Anopheles albimanus TaxID=7167 RepID=A0A8W7K2I2_ANOAL